MRRCISGRCFSPSENREEGEVTTGNMSVLRRLYLALSSFASLLHTLISPDSFVCVCVFLIFQCYGRKLHIAVELLFLLLLTNPIT